jgi:hypothetical protein
LIENGAQEFSADALSVLLKRRELKGGEEARGVLRTSQDLFTMKWDDPQRPRGPNGEFLHGGEITDAMRARLVSETKIQTAGDTLEERAAKAAPRAAERLDAIITKYVETYGDSFTGEDIPGRAAVAPMRPLRSDAKTITMGLRTGELTFERRSKAEVPAAMLFVSAQMTPLRDPLYYVTADLKLHDVAAPIRSTLDVGGRELELHPYVLKALEARGYVIHGVHFADDHTVDLLLTHAKIAFG